MDWWAQTWTVHLLMCLFCIEQYLCIDVHLVLDWSDWNPVLTYNASQGPDWLYTGRGYRVEDVISVDSRSGCVYVKPAAVCRLRRNPVIYTVFSHRQGLNQQVAQSDSTAVPLTLHFHKLPCHVPSSRQTSKSRHLLEVSQYNEQMNSSDNTCFQKGQYIASLKNSIPKLLSKTICDISFERSDISFDLRSLELLSSNSICVDKELVILGEIHVCDSSPSVPFRLTAHGQSSPSMEFNVISPWTSTQRRIKRETTNDPVFAESNYKASVMENGTAGTPVIRITASDGDEEAASTLSYTLESIRDSRSTDMFDMDATSGLITTHISLDRELIPVHVFKITATDDGPQRRRTASTTLTVTVLDANDHVPTFAQSVYNISKPENIPISSPILTIRATDGDIGDNADIKYSFTSPSNTFYIDPIQGRITTLGVLDREEVASYQLKVQAIDQAQQSNERKSSTATINIRILDENDNFPQFSKSSYSVNMSEDIDISQNKVVGRVSATDLDEGRNQDIRYSVTSGNTHNTFTIDPTTGVVSIQRALDYEEETDFRLRIQASDNGEPPAKTNTTLMWIRVLDVNDNDPEFQNAPYMGSVLENKDIGSPVLMVRARDIDSGANQALVYSIPSPPRDLPFTINSNSGQVSVSSPLNRETKEQYTFVVKVEDKGVPSRSATTTVNIFVLDVNDNEPVFTQETYYATVSEKHELFEPVVRVTATDKDAANNAIISYRIVSGNNDRTFSLDETSGIISLFKKLSYKIQNRYILTVEAVDNDGHSDTAEVHINVTDVNKDTPHFEQSFYQLKVEENAAVGEPVGKVKATDQDVGENGRIRYEIVGEIKQFSIDPVSGQIATREVLDRETQPGYSFTVKASDHGKPPQNSTTIVYVAVEDMNDNPPLFVKTPYSGSVEEGSYVGVRVLQVSAKDADSQNNAQVWYRFQAGSDGTADFEVDSATGDIRVAQGSDIDRERTSNYTLMIEAVDRGDNPLSSSVAVTIKVTDINDNAPRFSSEKLTALVPENKPIGSTVAVITAVDIDDGQNAIVEYSLENRYDVDKFELYKLRLGDPATIVNLIELDYESDRKFYTIVLKATSGTLFSTAEVTIEVQDLNDNPPQLKDFTIIFNNNDFVEDFPTGPVGRIPAFDPDVSDRDKLQYSFIVPNEARFEFLSLNQSTGEITLDPRLNSDVARNGTIQVRVSDGLNDVKATCHMYFRLVSDEMLKNSVTIRLNEMTSEAFLSPLYDFFVDALATIIKTDKSNVFVINVQNDTDVKAQVLNVTVSVRKEVDRSDRHLKDVFYPVEYLQEQIYLKRTHLANLSYVQVLPFDDNLCLSEPCTNFESCSSSLWFGEASDFIASDTMLFRPILPVNGYKCTCPKGFTGMDKDFRCDVEVNFCYSNPCNHSGTCVRHEGGYTCQCKPGYTGDNCEIDLSEKVEVCPDNVCRPPSQCQVLIEGGFRCEKCPDQVNYNQFCQLTTRTFPRGSFLMFPSLKRRNRFTVQLKFATMEKQGLLFYNGRFNEQHDFIALEIVDGQVQFSFSLGPNITTVAPYVEGGVSDGQWHQVTVDYLNRTATVTVGEDCDTEISVRYGHHINYTCAARATKVLEDRCALSFVSCYRLLDLTGPFQIGGIPSLPANFQIQNKEFVGCIKDVYIDSKLLDLSTSVSNNGTQPGCLDKNQHCRSSPCLHGGTCAEGWGTYVCQCPPNWGGIDCSQPIDIPRRFRGTGYMYYSNELIPAVHFPWYNGISFRTRNKNGVLMHIIAERGESVVLEMLDGYLVYRYGNSVENQIFVFDAVRVNDGNWHYFEARWQESLNLIMVLDYGQRQKQQSIRSTLKGKTVDHVYIGTERLGSVNGKNFTGCIENARVGNTQSSTLTRPSLHNVEDGCPATELCKSNPCTFSDQCIDEWEGYRCPCPPGTMGPKCRNICTTYNPCQNMAHCRHPQGGSYECQCGVLQSGKYCEQTAEQPCPAGWWGYPVCGPCDASCTRENGFDPNCNKTTGQCSCLENYYQPPGSEVCLDCKCYRHGSTSAQCDPVTGQCPCIEGVIGRRCDQCPSKFAEICMDEETEEYKCRVDYLACPRSYSHGFWWDPEIINATALLGVTVYHDCPGDASGMASRVCGPTGLWGEPDFFNCTNPAFESLLRQYDKIESGELLMTAFVAKTTVASLASATSSAKQLFGSDLSVSLRVLQMVLDYEVPLTGLNLTSERDSQYLMNLVSAMSDIFSIDYMKEWQEINKKEEGLADLVVKLEAYLRTLVTALEVTASVYGSPQPYNIVTDNIVLGVDTIRTDNFTGKKIPKYDNIIKRAMFDEHSNIFLPQSSLSAPPLQDFLSLKPLEPKAYVGYIMYKHLGDLLPKHYAGDVRVIDDRPMSVNSPVFTIVLSDNGSEVTGSLTEPVIITLKQLMTVNRTSPQCVFWNTDKPSGEWSTHGCTEKGRYQLNEMEFVECSCSHMTSFAVLMDISDTEYKPSEQFTLDAVIFIGVILCMCCLVLSFLVFLFCKRLWSNTTSIHSNLVVVIFLTELAFLIGINSTEQDLFCRLIAITLHYFYMAGFAWLFVDVLHIYRMLTEIRNIDTGSMKFYYLIGYVIPGIIASLAVGLNTEGYGNSEFCWLSIEDKFIWAFTGPISVAVIVTIFTFCLAVSASCREKVTVSDLAPLRLGLLANIIILMLWGIIWVIGLLGVNFSVPALHYVYALLSLSLGVFIFFIYILINHKVRGEVKKAWYRMQGKTLEAEENIAGTRSSLYSKSALAYHNDMDGGTLQRHNVGISTNSTTSRSTSKSSGGIYKGEDYLRSTSTSTSGNLPPVNYPKNSPYGYDPQKNDGLDDPDSMQIHSKPCNDSDSDSEMSVGQASLDLASSHSSDDDDDLDIEMDWEKQLPKNQKIEKQKLMYRGQEFGRKEQAKEQARLKKKEREAEVQQQQPATPTPPHPGFAPPSPPVFRPPPLAHTPGQWPGDPQLTTYGSSDTEYPSQDQPTTLSSIQPDVTLQTPEYRGRVMITPPQRTDSLMNDSSSSNTKGPYSSPFGSPRDLGAPRTLGSPQGRMKVQVLTHRGSISSDSE